MRFLNPGNPAGRLEYLLVTLLIWAASFWATIAMLEFTFDPATREYTYRAGSIETFLFVMVLLWGFSMINTLRRMKDLNMSGVWVLLIFVPIIGIIFQLFLLLSSGVSKTTYAPYGDDPYNPDSWVPNPGPNASASSPSAVSFQGKPLLLPGEEVWTDEEAA